MSIRTASSLQNRSLGVTLAGGLARTTNETGFGVNEIDVTTVEEAVVMGEFSTPRDIIIVHKSGDPLKIGLATGVYPLRIIAGEAQSFRLDVEGLIETQTIVTGPSTGNSLDGTYFVVEDVSGETWAIGFGITSSPANHTIGFAGSINGALAPAIAANLYSAMIGNAAFLLLFDVVYDAAVDDDFITITDKHTGTRTQIADGASTAATGFALARTQTGAVSPAVYMQSTGASVVAVATGPN
jgi:hypothetical protein|tara:strand:+ start:451 stop:1173 length:723 start_codon:yes stop_codon:yes gene_type:complete